MTATTTLAGALTSTGDRDWIMEEAGYDPLGEGSRGSSFAISNGFVGVRGVRAIHRGGG
jgi:trehalose/maltose hydrolase-like predicted phosphorylase